jgi:hypothetical protein
MTSSPLTNLIPVARGNGKSKRGTPADLRLNRHGAAMPLGYLLADGQSYTGAGVLVPSVQSLEHSENLVEVLRFDSDAIVLHRDDPSAPAIPGSRDMYPGHFATLVLDGIADEILKQLNQLHVVRKNDG